MISGSLSGLLLELKEHLHSVQKYLIIPLLLPFLITLFEPHFIQLLALFYSHL